MNKRIQRIRPLLVLLLLVFGLIGTDTVAKATDKGAEVPVSYLPGEMAGWPGLELELSVKGQGAAQDGNSRVRSGTLTYTLEKGDEKTFQFLPDEGSRLVRLTLNGENVLDKLSPVNQLTVTMGEENQRIEAVFSGYQSIKTGDMANPSQWWTLVFLSFLVILLVLAEQAWERKRRKVNP